MTIADTLSRAYTTDNATDKMEEELECAVPLIHDTCASEIWLQEIKEATCKDQSMQKTTYDMDGLKSSHRYLKRYETIGIFVISYQKLMKSC